MSHPDSLAHAKPQQPLRASPRPHLPCRLRCGGFQVAEPVCRDPDSLAALPFVGTPNACGVREFTTDVDISGLIDGTGGGAATKTIYLWSYFEVTYTDEVRGGFRV